MRPPPPSVTGAPRPTQPTPDRAGWADPHQQRPFFRSLVPHDGTNVEALNMPPRMWIAAMLVNWARAGDLPAMKTTVHGNTELLTITASNGTWVYVVGQLDSGRDAYFCHWPD
jgi:hypothetical protein